MSKINTEMEGIFRHDKAFGETFVRRITKIGWQDHCPRFPEIYDSIQKCSV